LNIGVIDFDFYFCHSRKYILNIFIPGRLELPGLQLPPVRLVRLSLPELPGPLEPPGRLDQQHFGLPEQSELPGRCQPLLRPGPLERLELHRLPALKQVIMGKI
jgi:hypothetical protein